VIGQKMAAALVSHLVPFLLGGAGIALLILSAFWNDERTRRIGLLLVVVTGPLSVALSMAIVGG
jgi:hypothetical protein